MWRRRIRRTFHRQTCHNDFDYEDEDDDEDDENEEGEEDEDEEGEEVMLRRPTHDRRELIAASRFGCSSYRESHSSRSRGRMTRLPNRPPSIARLASTPK